MQVCMHAGEMTCGAGRGVIPSESFVEKERKGGSMFEREGGELG